MSRRWAAMHRLRDRLRFAFASLPVLALALAAGTASATPEVYGESAMVKVRPSTPPHRDTGLSLVGARNEFISFQVVVHGGDSGVRNTRADFSGLTGPATLTGADVTLYREAFLDIRTPTYPTSEAGRWPDALVPDVDEISGEKRNAFPFDVPAGESRAIWVDIHVPQNAPPGAYSGAVQVTGDGVSFRVPVALQVVDVTLPSTSSLTTAFLLYLPNVCQAHQGNADCGGTLPTFELMARYQRMALEHRITLSNPLLFVPDWSHFDALYGPFLDGAAATRLPGAKMTSIQYAGPRDAPSYAAFAAHFREKGWLDRAYDYTYDEPSIDSHFAEIAQRAATVRKGAPELRTLVTTSLHEAEAHQVTPDIDLMVSLVSAMDGTSQPFLGDQRPRYDSFLNGERRRLWLYESCASWGCGGGAAENTPNSGWPSYAVDTSAAKNRAMQWIDFREKASGELYYETALALPTAWTDVYRFGGNGDGTLFYPGTPAVIGGTTGVPVASLRLKQIRAGLQDYELLKMVSDSGDSTFARNLVNEVVPSSHQITDDGSVFESARLKLLARLVELRKQGNGVGTGTGTRTGPTEAIAGPTRGPGAITPAAASTGCGSSASAGLPSMGLLLLLAAWRCSAMKKKELSR